MSNLLISITRVVSAAVIGFLLNLPITPLFLNWVGVTTDQASAYLGAAVSLIISSLYFAAVRYLEENHGAAWGRFLVLAKRPLYRDAPRDEVA